MSLIQVEFKAGQRRYSYNLPDGMEANVGDTAYVESFNGAVVGTTIVSLESDYDGPAKDVIQVEPA
jgi:hypothetical protein